MTDSASMSLQDFGKLVGRAEQAEAEVKRLAALLGPSPCPNGCRMCDWVEGVNPSTHCCFCGAAHRQPITLSDRGYAGEPVCETCGKGGQGEPDEAKMAYRGYCRRCAELERVRHMNALRSRRERP